jgi:hypothetical protein
VEGAPLFAPVEARRSGAAVTAAERYRAFERRWAALDQLVTGVTPIPWSLAAEVRDGSRLEPRDDWAEILVQAAAFAHVRVSGSGSANGPSRSTCAAFAAEMVAGLHELSRSTPLPVPRHATSWDDARRLSGEIDLEVWWVVGCLEAFVT